MSFGNFQMIANFEEGKDAPEKPEKHEFHVFFKSMFFVTNVCSNLGENDKCMNIMKNPVSRNFVE